MDAPNDPSPKRKRKRDKPHRHQSKSRSSKSCDRRKSSQKEKAEVHPTINKSNNRTTPQTTKIQVPYNAVPPRPDIEEVPQDNKTKKHWGQVVPFPGAGSTPRQDTNNICQREHHEVNKKSNNDYYQFNVDGRQTTQDSKIQASAPLPSLSHGNNSTTTLPTRYDANNQGGDNTTEPKLIPCKARGMPQDHNMITAYFTIQNTIKHADELFCSHPACRNAGPRFLYCKFCEVPVAKRNFRQRHSHLEMYPEPRLALGAQEAMAQGNYVVGQHQQQQEQQGQHHDNNNNNNNDMHIPEGVARIQASSSSNSSTSSDNSDTATIQQQRREWEKLLCERPHSEHGDEMSAWLMKVMATSKKESKKKTANAVDTRGG